jgi:hypothetical protein
MLIGSSYWQCIRFYFLIVADINLFPDILRVQYKFFLFFFIFNIIINKMLKANYINNF